MGEYTEFDEWSKERLPAYLRVPKRLAMATQLKSICDQLDVRFVDTTSELRTCAATGELVYDPRDIHFSPRGHKVVSRLLVEEIRDLKSSKTPTGL